MLWIQAPGKANFEGADRLGTTSSPILSSKVLGPSLPESLLYYHKEEYLVSRFLAPITYLSSNLSCLGIADGTARVCIVLLTAIKSGLCHNLPCVYA